jgi:hypothetical protein
MIDGENPVQIWNNFQKYLSLKIVRSMIKGAVIGGISVSSIYFAQVVFNTNEEHRSFFGAFFVGALVGAVVGFLAYQSRRRNCPKCGQCMGPSQIMLVGGINRASSENQLDLGTWTTRGENGIQHHIENFYLCKNCDREFRETDLNEFEATHKEVDVGIFPIQPSRKDP